MRILILILLFATKAYANFPPQAQVRSVFQKAAKEEKYCRYLIKIVGVYNERNSALLGGYNACATMMMAKYVFNPVTKLSSFIKGKELLERCIATDKQNIELRFLRYTMQMKSPFFLRYRSSIKEDEAILVKGVPNIKDIGLRNMIVDFFKTERA